MSQILVAVDGPAGSGKSSVSKQAARKLGFGYLDTGASYRALTLWAQKQDLDLDGVGDLDLGSLFGYEISTDPDDYWVRVNGDDYTQAIRGKEVELAVSQVASQPKVRAFMREQTRRLARECPFPGIIVEGRDITSVVLPDAQTRVLLTASEEVRLARRASDLAETDSLGAQLSERDQKDARVVDFHNPAPGVSLLDTTDLNFEQTVSALCALIENN